MASLPSQADVQRYAEIAEVASRAAIKIGQLLIEAGQVGLRAADSIQRIAD